MTKTNKVIPEAQFGLHVVAAVITDATGKKFLLAKRPSDKDQGGLWEFPGGKVEPGEDSVTALRRELNEELGIHVRQYEPLFQFSFNYPQKNILFSIYTVDEFDGDAHGREAQQIQWYNDSQLHNLDFPAANTAILNALQLPPLYAITPAHNNILVLINHIEQLLKQDIHLVQWRNKNITRQDYLAIAQALLSHFKHSPLKLMLNGDPQLLQQTAGAYGIQLPSRQLHKLTELPATLREEFKFAASCHTIMDVHRANALGVDFCLLSPVLATQSHPDTPALGWEQAGQILKNCHSPCYALGGMNKLHQKNAKSQGFFGLAGISGFWPKNDA